MLPYIILLGIVFISLLFIKMSNNERLRYIPFFILSLYSGFRFQVGIDTVTYEKIFDYIINLPNYSYNIEWGYKILVIFVDKLGGTQQLVFLIFAFITNYLIYKYIINQSPNYYLSTIIYMCFGPLYLSSMNGMRQALAISVFVFSIKYITEKKPLKYIINLSFFSLFHSSLLLMIPFYWILKSKFNYLILFLTLPFVIVLFRIGIVDTLIQAIGYGNLLDFGLITLNAQYVLFLIMAMVITLIFYNLRVNSDYLRINLSLTYFSMYTILVGLFVNSAMNIIFTRFNLYFLFSNIVLIPFVIERFKEKNVIKLVLIIVLIIMYFNTIINSKTMLPFEFNLKLVDW